MNLLPIIERELMVAARQQASWHLRLAFATGAVLAGAFGLFWPDTRAQDRGQVMLVCQAVVGLTLSLFAGAYLTADSVSAEKREGTLGLLFLTPLRGWQIVVGKMIGHSFQVGFAWLATFPVFFLPILHGGVLWAEVARLLLALWLTLLLSLACGMFWSTRCTEARSSVLATVVSMLLLNFLPWAPAFVRAVFLRRSGGLGGVAELSPMTLVVKAFEMNYRASPAAAARGLRGDVAFWNATSLSLAMTLGCIAVAGWALPRLWRRAEAGATEARPSRWRAGLDRLRRHHELRWGDTTLSPGLWAACRELGENAGMRILRRLAFVFLGVMLIASVTTGHWEEGFISAMGIALAVHVIARVQAALAVTRRLSEDRRSGALELLLVTPLDEAELMQAHCRALRLTHRGLFRSLVAANVVLQLMVVVFHRPLHIGNEWPIFTVFFTGGLLITLADFRLLPWLGLRASLRAPTHLRAAGRVFATLVGLPWLGFAVAFLVATQSHNDTKVAYCFLTWAVGCLLFDAWLIRRCQRRLAGGWRRLCSEAG